MPAGHSSLARSFNYAEYTLKQQAIDALQILPANSHAQLFDRDKGDADNPGSQVFVISTPKQIYQRSVSALINGTPTIFYEWMGPFQKANGDESVKLALDLDMEGVDASRAFNDDIVWTVDHVARALENAFHSDVPRSSWIVLKTDYDPIKRKHSAHLVLDRFKFANVDARKIFLGNLDLVTELSERWNTFLPKTEESTTFKEYAGSGHSFANLMTRSRLSRNIFLASTCSNLHRSRTRWALCLRLTGSKSVLSAIQRVWGYRYERRFPEASTPSMSRSRGGQLKRALQCVDGLFIAKIFCIVNTLGMSRERCSHR